MLSQAGESDKLNEWVRLTSSDGYDYLVRKKVALGSGTLRDMLNAESTRCLFQVPLCTTPCADGTL